MDKLKAIRESAGVTQNGLATTIGKSHAYVWNVEAGRIALSKRETIAAWADALDVSADEIYHAIGAVPHDLLEQLASADVETWEKVRDLIF